MVASVADQASQRPETVTSQGLFQAHAEPDRDGNWWADMGPVDGSVLGPFENRTEALRAERGWLLESRKRVVGAPTRVTTLRFLASP